MKKLALALVLLLVAAPSVLGQSVGASQVRKKTNGGLTADSANALAVGIYRGASAPASPVTGQLWQDTTTTPAAWKTWSGTAWEAAPSAAGLTQADLSSFPASPSDGQILWIRSLRRAVIYDATAATWFYIDAQGRPAQADYSLETAGYSSAFLTGPGATTGSVTAGGSVTIGTHVCATNFFSSTGGDTLVGTSTATLTATSGQQTLSLTIPTGGAGTRGRRVWCSKAGTATPLFLINTTDDNTTTAVSVAIADTSFSPLTPPGIDYSAPIPSGWSVWLPAASYGGCGSTGSALLCAALTQANNAAGDSNVRLLYGLTPSTAAWRATWKVSRLDRGWTGNTGTGGSNPLYLPVVALATSASVAAPSMWAGVLYGNSSGPIPLTPTATTGFGSMRRPAGAAWATVSQGASSSPPIVGTPFWVSVRGWQEGSVWVYQPYGSQNGADWRPMMNATASITATSCNQALCSADEMTFVGFSLERGMSTSALNGVILEVKEFTFKTE